MDSHNHHLHIIKHLQTSKALHNKFNDLIIADTFRLLALSMISVFIPIFLLKIGLSLWNVAIFELANFILSVTLHYFIIPLGGQIGVKKIMISSYLINSLTYLILYYGPQLYALLHIKIFLSLITLFNALPLALYWSSHHIYFLKSTKSKNSGEKLGLLQSVPLIISIAGPFIGSLLIVHYSFREVFLLSTLLLFIASFFLFLSKDIKIKSKLTWHKIIDTNNFKKNTVFFLQGIGYCATSFIWPVLLFLTSVKLITMGFFYLLSNSLTGLTVYLGGKDSNKHSGYIIRIGAIGHGLSMILRALSSTLLFMATFQSMGGLFGGLLHIAIDANFYKYSHHDIANAIMNRELYMHLGRITVILILLIAMTIFNFKIALILVLLIAGSGTFILFMIIKREESFMKQNLSHKINFSKLF